MVFVRNTGKLCFATLQGGTEGKRIQAMLSLAEVGEESLAEWKSLVDLGDHVFVTGRVIVSRLASCPFGDRLEDGVEALRPCRFCIRT